MPEPADILLEQALEARRDHRLDEAERDLILAADLCRETEAWSKLAKTLTRLGQVERDLHRGQEALEHYQEAAALYRAEGDTLRLAHTVRHVGDIYQDAGRNELAEPCYAEALAIYRNDERTSSLDLANAIRSMALLRDNAGDAADAATLWQEARDLYAAVNVKEGVAESSRRIASLTHEEDHH